MAASTAENFRAFIAIALEPALVTELQKLQRQLQAELPEGAVRWTKAEQLHLTLRFLGKVSGENRDRLTTALHCACDGTRSFQLALQEIGCFPNTRNPRVVWVGIRGDLDPLRRLQQRIELETREFGDSSEERTFQPHLTVGRVRIFGKEARSVGETVERATVPNLGIWMVRRIGLVQSTLAPQGARYTTLASINLMDDSAESPLSPPAP